MYRYIKRQPNDYPRLCFENKLKAYGITVIESDSTIYNRISNIVKNFNKDIGFNYYTIYSAFVDDIRHKPELINKFIKFCKEKNTYIWKHNQWYNQETNQIDYEKLKECLQNEYINQVSEIDYRIQFSFIRRWNEPQDLININDLIVFQSNTGFYDAFFNHLDKYLDNLDYFQDDKKRLLNKYIDYANKLSQKFIDDEMIAKHGFKVEEIIEIDNQILKREKIKQRLKNGSPKVENVGHLDG
ncbi:hypothetical protein [Mycoplasmopsis primatum]|uniref:hypothetical protein n=1 Tax=Mycoplasmopsis primatum TaxID=55604 RepID=UPI00049612CC|nr:hypothetical protein [Mycoplasmopsis primatum]